MPIGVLRKTQNVSQNVLKYSPTLTHFSNKNDAIIHQSSSKEEKCILKTFHLFITEQSFKRQVQNTFTFPVKEGGLNLLLPE